MEKRVLEPLVDVTGVKVLARYVVELTFAEGAVRVIDLEPLMSWSFATTPST